MAPSISLGIFSPGATAPSGILKLSNIRKASKIASSDFGSVRTDAVKAAARTKRDGGVKSQAILSFLSLNQTELD